MSDKKKHRNANQYLLYLKRGLSNQERHSFERDLEANPFEKEAMEGLESLTPNQAEEDILSLHSRMRKRIGKKRRIAWYSAAASIAALLIIGTVFLQIHDFNPEEAEKTLNEEAFPPAPSESTQGAIQDNLSPEEKIKPEQETEDRAKSSDAPTDTPTEAPAKAPAKAPEKITYVEAEAVPQKEEARFDHVVSEAAAAPQTKDVQLDYVVSEAEAAPRGNEMRAEEPGRRAKKRNEAMMQPTLNQTAVRRISGIVVSGEDMEPIPGASVLVKGTKTGVVTDMDGQFNLPLQDDSNSTVVASFVGMETQEYKFEDEADVQLVMQPDALTLDEVVVVGQDIQAGSISSALPSIGYNAFKQYIEKNITFPDADTSAARAVVVLSFTVTSAGEIININPLRTQGEPFTQEAIRLLKEGPPWTPALDNTGNIPEIVRLRIVFKK